jgi:hypothetical protein
MCYVSAAVTPSFGGRDTASATTDDALDCLQKSWLRTVTRPANGSRAWEVSKQPPNMSPTLIAGAPPRPTLQTRARQREGASHHTRLKFGIGTAVR